MRSEFEKLPEVKDSLSENIVFIGNKYTAANDGFYDLVNWLNGAWYAYQHQQSKVDELQKRVDAAKYYMKNIFSGDAEVDQCHLGDLLDILDGKIVDEIEQALKGESNG